MGNLWNHGENVVPSCHQLCINKSHGHWLLGDGLQFINFAYHELCDELANQIILDSLGDLEVNVFDVKLEYLIVCIKHHVLELFIFEIFFFFCMDLIGNKAIIILVLMLDPKFKSTWTWWPVTWVGECM